MLKAPVETHGRALPWRRVASVVGALAVSGGALWLLHQKVWVDASATSELVTGSHLGWVLVSVLLVPLQVVLAAERWRLASAGLGLPLSRQAAWREFYLSMGLNQLLPGGVGGDVVRVWRQRSGGLATATRAAVADRVLGWVVLAVTAALGLLCWAPLTGHDPPQGAVPAAVSLTVAAMAALAVPKVIPGIGRVAADLRVLLRSRPVPLVLLSFALTLSILASLAVCARAVGAPVNGWVLAAGPVALLAMSIPLSFAGWGLREASLVPLLGVLGWRAEPALALSVLAGVTLFIGALPGLFVLGWPPVSPESP